MQSPPTGTVTFLFTDIVGSTRLWEERPDEMRAALADHDRIVRSAVEAHGGYVFATGGDGFAVAFQRAGDAVDAAGKAQAGLAEHPLITVRMGIHSGEVQERGGDYFGSAVNRAARLMAIGHGGQVVCSAVTASLLDAKVDLRFLGEHRLRDLLAPQRVFQLGDGRFPALRSIDAVPSNLPTQLTELIGRSADVESLARAARTERLVTLTGTGGVGKTRLALAVAAALADDFGDGCWLVELAAQEASGVTAAVAAALGMNASVIDTKVLVGYLAQRRLVLVLDNCEHVLGSVADLVVAVLGAAPEVHVIVTSREPLALDGEVVRGVRSLSVPDPDASEAELFASSAVRLFVERARAASDRFELSADNRSAVVEICRRLDGIPLAIELAAARVRSMTPALIEERLDERFRLLSSTRRSQERHRTLLATVTWSYEMLSMDEQSVFRRLAVFPSGFDVAAAEVVAASDGDSYLLDDLSRLVDRSLVQHDPNTGRYRLLETLRQFGAERLAECGDTEYTADRYLNHYRRLAAQIGPRWYDAGVGDAIATAFAAEFDNLRATANSLRRLGRYDDLLSFCGDLFAFLQQCAPAEVFEWIHAALANGIPRETDRIAADGFLAHLCHSLNRLDEGLRHASDSLDASAATAGPDSVSALTGRIVILSRLGENEEALVAARRMVALGEHTGNEFVRLQGRFYMASILAMMERWRDAEEILVDALPAARRLGNSQIEGIGALVAIGNAIQTNDRAALSAIMQTVPQHTDDTAISNYLRTFRAYAVLDTEPREALRLAIETVRRGDRTGNQVVLNLALAITVNAAALCGQASAAEQLYRHMTASPYWDHRNTWEISLLNGARAAVPAEVRDTKPHALSRRELLQLLSELAVLP